MAEFVLILDANVKVDRGEVANTRPVKIARGQFAYKYNG